MAKVVNKQIIVMAERRWSKDRQIKKMDGPTNKKHTAGLLQDKMWLHSAEYVGIINLGAIIISLQNVRSATTSKL